MEKVLLPSGKSLEVYEEDSQSDPFETRANPTYRSPPQRAVASLVILHDYGGRHYHEPLQEVRP